MSRDCSASWTTSWNDTATTPYALMNFRVVRCHQPQAIKLMAQEWLPAWGGQGDDDRERLEQVAARYRQDHIAERQVQAERNGTLSVTPRSLKPNAG